MGHRVTELGATVFAAEIEEHRGADNFVGVARSESPLEHCFALVALGDLALQFCGGFSIWEWNGAPVSHHVAVGKDLVKTVDIVFGNPTQDYAWCGDDRKCFRIHWFMISFVATIRRRRAALRGSLLISGSD